VWVVRTSAKPTSEAVLFASSNISVEPGFNLHIDRNDLLLTV